MQTLVSPTVSLTGVDLTLSGANQLRELRDTQQAARQPLNNEIMWEENLFHQMDKSYIMYESQEFKSYIMS